MNGHLATLKVIYMNLSSTHGKWMNRQPVFSEVVQYPLLGSNVKGLRFVKAFGYFGRGLLLTMLAVGVFFSAFSAIDTTARIIIMLIVIPAVILLVYSDRDTKRWLFAATPIVIYEEWIEMPVTLFERVVLGKKRLIQLSDIETVQMDESIMPEYKGAAELLVTTKAGVAYRSYAKRRGQVDEMTKAILQLRPSIRIEHIQGEPE